MKADAMVWVQRIVGAIFVIGVAALIGAIVTQVGPTEGLPPLPIFLGLLGTVLLILISGICLALISLAISARKGLEALHRMGGQGQVATLRDGSAPRGIFSPSPLRNAADASGSDAPAPARPGGRRLVAER